MNDNYAIAEDKHTEDIDDVQLVGMKLGDEEYAIDVLKIQEIIRTVEITIIPRAETYVLGVMNLRGKVIPVIDLRVRFNLNKTDFDKSTRIIVVRFEKEHIGFVVDEVTQVIRIEKNMVEPTPPLVGAVGQEYILGICKYRERLIILLDIDRVVLESGDKSESDLRKRFTEKKNGPIKKAPPRATIPPKAKLDAEIKPEPVRNSMADEAGAQAAITIVPAKSDADFSDILDDAIDQSKVKNAPASSLVEQDDLDSLIARELTKREAETEELNSRRKAEAAKATTPTPAPAAVKQDLFADEDALSIDELIAKELAKREAETEELNKKKSLEDDKKKNELSNEAEPVAVTNVAETAAPDKAAEPVNKEDQSSGRAVKGYTSLSELKSIASKIISGEAAELDMDITGEMGELIRLLVDIKDKVDDIQPSVLDSAETLPYVQSTLADVNDSTEKAAHNILASTQSVGNFYKALLSTTKSMEKALQANDKAAFEQNIAAIRDDIAKADHLGLQILEGLEFQDITSQKINKVIRSINEMGARLGAIVGIMSTRGDKKEYNELLSDLGFN